MLPRPTRSWGLISARCADRLFSDSRPALLESRASCFLSRSLIAPPLSLWYSADNVIPLETTRVNNNIRAKEVRVIGPEGEALGVLPIAEALEQAKSYELDLIEISPNAVPPVAKIMDYGKFQYEQQKKRREIKAKSHTTETKAVQVKIGTGEHDLNLKASKAAQWLSEGHRVKVDLFLWGRYKGMEFSFLKERLERFLKLIPTEYKIADPIAKGPKGLTCVLERVGGKK